MQSPASSFKRYNYFITLISFTYRQQTALVVLAKWAKNLSEWKIGKINMKNVVLNDYTTAAAAAFLAWWQLSNAQSAPNGFSFSSATWTVGQDQFNLSYRWAPPSHWPHANSPQVSKRGSFCRDFNCGRTMSINCNEKGNWRGTWASLVG